MTLHPHGPTDLALAPVAISIDMNLRPLRDCREDQIDEALELVLDRPDFEHTRQARAARVLQAALRNVNLHGWEAALSDDRSSIHLSGGSESLDIALGASVLRYLEA